MRELQAIRQKAADAVNCQSVTLPSGLTVLCRTMPGYSSVHAMYATNFGSVVREFTLNGRRISLPAGTAHFLEHKMFESEQGDAQTGTHHFTTSISERDHLASLGWRTEGIGWYGMS